MGKEEIEDFCFSKLFHSLHFIHLYLRYKLKVKRREREQEKMEEKNEGKEGESNISTFHLVELKILIETSSPNYIQLDFPRYIYFVLVGCRQRGG